MIYIAIFLIAAGLFMLFKPGGVWTVTEKWKSSGADEPSSIYIVSIRIGGALCTLAGLASTIVYLSGQ